MKLSLSGSLQHNDEGDLKKNILKAAVVFTLSFLHSFLVQFCKCDSTHFLLWTSFQNQRSHKGRNCKSEFFAFINKRSIVEGNISQLSCTCCSIKEAVFTLIGKIAFIATHFFYLYKCVHVHPARLHFKCVEKKKVWKYVCTL